MEERLDYFNLFPKDISIGRRYREIILTQQKSQNCLKSSWMTFHHHLRHLITARRNFCQEMSSIVMILKLGCF